jgi:hypothetical protein
MVETDSVLAKLTESVVKYHDFILAPTSPQILQI